MQGDFNLLIIFTDKTEKVVYGINNYGKIKRTFWFEKSGYRNFVPEENVVFFGRDFDYNNGR